ncbi:MAG: DNA mismatch repair protein MutS [Rhodobacteraceae bacterium]|nr:DNA mismatch repair protein MutS [Paracoccaceae bacterium]
MMAQYLNLKNQYQDALLFYRMGDFYELFFEDAVAAAEALDIALTKRGKHLGEDVAMCGVPHHAAESYLLTLIRKGFRVAVCEQMESPSEAKKRGSKSVVNRDVVRLVTPGTLTEDSLLEARQHNFLAAFVKLRDDCALAWVDISTGGLWVELIPLVKLGPELARLRPSELLIPDSLFESLIGVTEEFSCALTPLSAVNFDSVSGEVRLKALFKIETLEAFGKFDRVEVSALGALVHYLDITQKGRLPLLQKPKQQSALRIMQIDAATRRSLEVTKALNGKRQGSLLNTIDKTITAAGARLLEQRLSSPSLDVSEILLRLDAVDDLCAQPLLRDKIRDALRNVPDLERALTRLSFDRGGPRDLVNIRSGLMQAKAIADILSFETLSAHLSTASSTLDGHQELLSFLDNALIDEPPLLTRDGGFIAQSFDTDLDDVRQLKDEGRSFIAKMQGDYIKLSQVQSLKIKHNNLLGYFIETPSKYADKMLAKPLNKTFIHRQTTANQVRFTTIELSEIETKIYNAGNRALEIEKKIFAELCRKVLEQSELILAASNGLAILDVSAGIAELSLREDWVRPVVDDSRCFMVHGGRHPVVEAATKLLGDPFVPNDCNIDDGGIWLLTGPNMSGKSTFLRQNALIAMLAQMGSYVPAKAAHIGLVTQLFSRVGASDDLARGRSTFMVEMIETAAILNQSGTGALVILDEIGRGTATYDGLSIAWATLEHLHDVNQTRALFATHYHELTNLSTKMERVENATVAVKEWEGNVIFLHEVKKGAADRSYGVQVAKLAGLPDIAVNRARDVLSVLEKGDREGSSRQTSRIDDLPLFNQLEGFPIPNTSNDNTIKNTLENIFPDELSPREALQKLYELKELLQKP